MRSRSSELRLFAPRRASFAVGSAILAALAVMDVSRAGAQTLDAVTSRALLESPRLKADQARQDATRQELTAAQAAVLFSVSINVDSTVNGTIRTWPLSNPPIPPHPGSVGATLTQPLFDGMRRFNEIRRATASVTAGYYALSDTEQQVRLDTATAYLAVLRDRTILALHQRSFTNLAGILASTRARFFGGETTKTDIAQASGRLEQARAELDRVTGDLAASSSEYERLVGAQPGQVIPSAVPVGLLPRTMSETVRLAEEANPKIHKANFTAIAADHAAQATISELAPNVDLQVGRARNYGYAPSIDTMDEFAVKVRVRVPLFEPGAIPRIGQARAIANQRHYEAVDARDGVTAAARTAFGRYQAGVNRANSLASQIKFVRAALIGVQKEAQGGQRTVLDVLNAEAEAVNAEVTNAIARYERDASAYVLLATVGRLTGNAQLAAR
jgi:TolC family type I secretion outer membrane protein